MDADAIVRFLNEAGMLARTPRSGLAFLGSGRQSVAEHSFRVAVIGWALARQVTPPADELKLLRLCLFHDFHEARIGDLNHLQQRYVVFDRERVLGELGASSSLGAEVAGCVRAFEGDGSWEARLARDADQLELLLVLKEQLELGHPRAAEWFESTVKMLDTDVAKQLAERIRLTPSDAWWKELLAR